MALLTLSYYDHYLRFCTAEQKNAVPVPHDYLEMDDTDLSEAFNQLIQGKHVWVWVEKGFRGVVRYCLSHYKYVKAAGGIVSAPDGSKLLIFREGNWDIPKGMVEPGETLAQAAIREVEEETSISEATLELLLGKTYHIYDKYGGWHLKQTTWYAMSCGSKSALRPQQEEGITQAVWLSDEECHEHLSHSFASLRLVEEMMRDQTKKIEIL